MSTLEVTHLAEGLSFGNGFPTASWSPDGRLIALIAEGPDLDYGCRIVNMATGTQTMIPAPEGAAFGADHRPPLWFEDGKYLLVASWDKLWRVDAERRAVAVAATVPTGIWDIVGSNRGRTFWSPDGGRSAVVLAFDPGSQRNCLWRADLQTGATRPVPEVGGELGAYAVFSVDTSEGPCRIVFKRESVDHPADLWVAEDGFSNVRQLTNLNPSHRDAGLGKSRIVAWTAEDGRELKGALLLPAGYENGKRYPLVVSVYPCIKAHHVNRYAIEGSPGLSFTDLQLFASRGYAVLSPDVPAGGPSEMKEIADYVHSGVDRVVEEGVADPDRLGVIGQSAGGYSVLCLVAQSARWHAGVAVSSFSDRVAQASATADGTAFWFSNAEMNLGSSPWKDRQVYIDNSPFFLLDSVETPILLIQGGHDTCTPPHLAAQTFSALQFLGKEAVYVRYDGEDHWPGAWRYANQLDFANRVLDWFQTHL